MEPMLTPQEVAEHLRIHVDEVRRLLKSGELRGVNIGRGSNKPRWRVEHEALEQFKRQLTGKQANQTPGRCQQRRKDYLEIL